MLKVVGSEFNGTFCFQLPRLLRVDRRYHVRGCPGLSATELVSVYLCLTVKGSPLLLGIADTSLKYTRAHLTNKTSSLTPLMSQYCYSRCES